MLFNLFSRRNKNNENSKPYLTKELTWDDEKIIEIRFNGKHPANTALPSDPISLNLVPT